MVLSIDSKINNNNTTYGINYINYIYLQIIVKLHSSLDSKSKIHTLNINVLN